MAMTCGRKVHSNGTIKPDSQLPGLQVHDATQDCEWVQPWICSQCTLNNAPSLAKCEACGGERPSR